MVVKAKRRVGTRSVDDERTMLAKLAVDLAGAMVSALNAHRMQLMWARSFLLNAEYISAAVLKRPLSHEETKLIESMQAAFNPDDRLWAQCQSSRQHQT